MGDKQKYYCLGCKEAFKRKDTCVMCQVCEEYTHPDCSGISKDLLKYLLDETNSGNCISWTCAHCKKVGLVLNNKVKALNKEFQEMKSTMQAMRNDHDKLEKEVVSVRTDCEENRRNITSSTKSVKNDIFCEIREREERKLNVIFYGVPEAGDDVKGKERKVFDQEWVQDVAYAVKVNLKETDVKFIKRIGEKKDENPDPRPILIGLKDAQIKSDLVSNSRSLKDGEFDGIHIVPDLTKQQREEEAELVKEMHKRNAELDGDLNSEWRVVGLKGEKRLVLSRIQERSHSYRGRGRGQSSRGSTVRGRGGANVRSTKRGRTPDSEISTQKRTRPSVVEEDEMEAGHNQDREQETIQKD